MEADSIAVLLLLPELRALIDSPDWEQEHLPRIKALAGRLGPVALDRLADALKTIAGIKITAFKKEAASSAATSVSAGPAGLPQIYFDARRYYKRAAAGYETLGREDIVLHLRVLGYAHPRGSDTPTPCEIVLHRIQTEHRVDYAGPLCGRPAGLWRENNMTVLATTSPRIIEPAEGDATPMLAFLASLFGRGRDPWFDRQLQTYMLWLKHARHALRNYQQSLPGQAVGLIGPQDCGKSLLQTITTSCLGGREADASLVIVRNSDFNAELWRAEHLRLGDEEIVEDSHTGIQTIKDRIKKLITADVYPLHQKYKDAQNFRPVWRVTLSGNDDDDSIRFFPLPIDNFSDKIIYLRCWVPLTEYHDGTPPARRAFFDGLINSLPAFLKLVDDLEISSEIHGARFGIVEFHHPHVVEAIEQASPIAYLGDYLLTVLHEIHKPIEGSAADIYAVLWERDGSRLSAIVPSPASLGWKLRRLSKFRVWRDMITSRIDRTGATRRHQTIWKITLPPKGSKKLGADRRTGGQGLLKQFRDLGKKYRAPNRVKWPKKVYFFLKEEIVCGKPVPPVRPSLEVGLNLLK